MSGCPANGPAPVRPCLVINRYVKHKHQVNGGTRRHCMKTHLERLSIRSPYLVSVSFLPILMLNSLSTSKTKEMAPLSGFMYSKKESFTTSHLGKKHTKMHIQEGCNVQQWINQQVFDQFFKGPPIYQAPIFKTVHFLTGALSKRYKMVLAMISEKVLFPLLRSLFYYLFIQMFISWHSASDEDPEAA